MTRRNPEVEAAQVEAVLEVAGVNRKMIENQLSTDPATISKIFNGKVQPHALWWLQLGRLWEQSAKSSGS